jgi:hypothetical protein
MDRLMASLEQHLQDGAYRNILERLATSIGGKIDLPTTEEVLTLLKRLMPPAEGISIKKDEMAIMTAIGLGLSALYGLCAMKERM